jgi:hypothetical protein
MISLLDTNQTDQWKYYTYLLNVIPLLKLVD